MTSDTVKYQIEKAIASLRLALEYGSKELNAYELGNITDAIKSLDTLTFTMKISDLIKKDDSDPNFGDIEKRVNKMGGFRWNNETKFVPAQDTDGL